MIKVLKFLTVLGLLLVSCVEEQDIETVSVPVRVDTVQQRLLSRPILTSGLLKAEKEINLSFKIGGFIDSIFVREGQQVDKDQCLAVLKLDEIMARVQQAGSGLEKAKRDYERVKRLYADSVTTLEQLQNAETALHVAQSDLKIAEFNLRHARIRAPSAGRILSQLMDENEMVSAGYPVFLFGKLDREWNVKTSVTETDIIKLNVGDTAYVTFDAYPNTRFTGHISQLSGTLSPNTGTFPLEITLKQVNGVLKSGFVARVELIPASKHSFFMLPLRALVEADGSDAFVYSVHKGRAQKHPVKLAFLTNDSAAVQSGLQNINRVITDGAAYLSEGMPVTIQQQVRPE